MTAVRLLLLVVVYALLTFVPVAAAMLAARYFGWENNCWLVTTGLCALGVEAYAVFWAYVVSPVAGQMLATTFEGASAIAIAAFAFKLRRLRPAALLAMLPCTLPFVIVIVATYSIDTAGYTYGGLAQPLRTAGARFAFPLPNDNELPYVFAVDLQSPHRPIPHPMSGAWLSSDRPPLQTGMYLLEAGTVAPAQRSTAFQYEIISTLLQSLWIIGLWVLLTALRVPRRATALALAACLFSGFVVLNTFYVWPKLVTAAYVLPVVAVALVGLPSPPRRQVFMGVLMGTAATLGMLLHTGTAFALIAIALSVVALRRRVPLRFAAVLVAFLVAGQGSWMMYQRFLDPPGDKLQQLQLAGVTDRDPAGLAHAISHAYGTLGVQGVLRQKIDNAQYVIGLPVNDAGALGTLLTARATGAPQISTRAEAADRIRVDTFFYMSEAGGIVSLAGVVAAAGLLSSRVRLRRESRIAGSLLLVVLFGLVAWCLIMFGPPEAASVVHQGTYVLPLLLITGAVIMLWSIARRFAVCLVAMHVLLTLALYWWLVPSHFAEPEPRNVAMQVASLGGVLVTVAILVRFGAGRGRVGPGGAAA